MVRSWWREAKARSTLPGVALTFDRTEDSDGNPWSKRDAEEINIPIGINMLELVDLLRETGLHIAMDPQLDLSAWEGMVPVELFGRQDFPPIGSQGYFFTLGPHAFYWFALERRGGEPAELGRPELVVEESWTELLDSDLRPLERVSNPCPPCRRRVALPAQSSAWASRLPLLR